MNITISHQTSYVFDEPVRLQPHVIRLHPRADATVRLLDCSLEIDPAPVVRAENLDLEGNVVTRAWFDEPTSHLTIHADSTVETLVADPFRFLLAEPERKLPYAYSPARGQRLSHYRSAPDAAHPSVREVALRVAHEAGRNQGSFPFALAQRLHEDFRVERRVEGDPNPPEVTVKAGHGTCRDLAVLFVTLCRAMGLAARFASGYLYDGDEVQRELHAWGEVYLIGGGWRGYDPSRGLACADAHVTLAASADPAEAAPVSGSFRGSAHATLDTSVELVRLSPEG